MWLRLWPLAYARPGCWGRRRISISIIALHRAEEVWGKSTFFFQGIKVFFQYFPEFLFSLRFDPLATTLLRSYQRHRRVTRLHTNNLKREAGKQQPGSVAWVSRLTGRQPSASDAGGGGLCLFCRWWMEEEGIIRKSTTQAGMVWRLCRSAALMRGTGAALFESRSGFILGHPYRMYLR